MNILTINTGSSSVRLAAFRMDNGEIAEELVRKKLKRTEESAPDRLRRFLHEESLQTPDLIVHRVVHGGDRLTRTCMLDEHVRSEIERATELAPLHNPFAVEWISACDKVFPALPQAAGFDTAFHADLPAVAQRYALPRDLCPDRPLRRFGFHGLAHQAMWERWCELNPDRNGRGRVISLQLGSGCSAAAVANGKPLDTSMGFTPLEGLVMGTRCGDIDAGLVAFLMRTCELSPDDIETRLNEDAGLLGLSGISADMEELLDSDDPSAREAIEVYCYRARKYIGAYLAVLGGADGIIFGGGVGEHAPAIRAGIAEGMEWVGICIDPQRNESAIGEAVRISPDNSPVGVWTLPVDEASLLARQALRLVDS